MTVVGKPWKGLTDKESAEFERLYQLQRRLLSEGLPGDGETFDARKCVDRGLDALAVLSAAADKREALETKHRRSAGGRNRAKSLAARNTQIRASRAEHERRGLPVGEILTKLELEFRKFNLSRRQLGRIK